MTYYRMIYRISDTAPSKLSNKLFFFEMVMLVVTFTLPQSDELGSAFFFMFPDEPLGN